MEVPEAEIAGMVQGAEQRGRFCIGQVAFEKASAEPATTSVTQPHSKVRET